MAPSKSSVNNVKIEIDMIDMHIFEALIDNVKWSTCHMQSLNAFLIFRFFLIDTFLRVVDLHRTFLYDVLQTTWVKDEIS